MIAAFFGHGAPVLAIDPVKGGEFATWGAEIVARHGRPRAIVVVSAHWSEPSITLGSTRAPATIHDFRGFPSALYDLRYPAPGDPHLADEVAALLGGGVARSERGFDHGVWTPLWHMVPDATIPVLQISLIDGARAVFGVGQRLATLLDSGVFIAGSGSITHNLGQIGADGEAAPAWAVEFDAWCADVVARRDWDALVDYRQLAPHAVHAHPTEEHLLPLLFAAGVGAAATAIRFPIAGFEFGSISRRCIEFDR